MLQKKAVNDGRISPTLYTREWETLSDTFTLGFTQPSAISANSEQPPKKFRLFQNYPNPFNNETLINYDLPL